MSNSWVLSTVLTDHRARNGDPIAPDLVGDINLRAFLKSWDRHDSHDRMENMYDNGRPRFRMRNLDFVSAERNDLLAAMVMSTPSTSQCPFIILQIMTSDMQPTATFSKKNMLLFFHLDSQDMPSFAGSAEYSVSQDPIDYVGAAEMRPQQASILKIGAHGRFGYYSIESRKAFSNIDPRFTVTETNYSDVIGTMQNMTFIPSTPAPLASNPKGNEPMRVLASFPIYIHPHKPDVHFQEGEQQTSGSSSQKLARLVNETYQNGGPRFLAEHRGSGNVIITVGSSQIKHAVDSNLKEGEQTLIDTAVLSRPYTDCVYRNVGVAPVATHDPIVRVAIIWQSTDNENPRSELYIYDIPVLISHASGVRLLTHPKSYQLPDDFQDYYIFPGKRITSLPQQFGGIHPLSPLWDLATTEAAKHIMEKNAALSGLQLHHSIAERDAHSDDVPNQKCFVWGPSSKDNTTSITCKAIDLTYSAHPRPTTSTTPLDKHSLCACPLHDDTFRITLPPIENFHSHSPPSSKPTSSKAPAQSQKSSFWPWKHRYFPTEEGPMAIITEVQSQPRQEALDRETEWFKERIRCMKASGMSNGDVAELWGCSRWTNYGQVRKPEGWWDL